MGTRSLTFIYEDEVRLVNMYGQFDGYPSGHGTKLAEFLASGKMVNGYSRDDEKQFNGMACLAAQMVAHFKHGVGGFYLFSPADEDCGQDYEYHVRFTENEFRVEVITRNGIEFEGNLEEFKAFCARGGVIMDTFIEFFSRDSYQSWEEAKEYGAIYGGIVHSVGSAKSLIDRLILEDCVEVALAAVRCVTGENPVEVRVRQGEKCFDPKTWEI